MSSRLSITFLLLLAAPAWAGNGDPVGGHPNYRERAILALTNACRNDPEEYRERWLGEARILRPKNYPPVRALAWTLPLGRSAREHSIDMATTPCFQHDSCDGTSLWDRIGAYYKGATSMAENIAAGYPTPLRTVNNWLLDGGAADHSKGDGHRRNIMAAKFTETGCGSANGGPMKTYDTQDFGNGARDFASPLVSGSHVIADGRILFLASFDATKGPTEATLVLDGNSIRMKRAFGTEEHGTWETERDAAARCRMYRFKFRDSGGKVWWYPEGGALLTTGEGGCAQEYQAWKSEIESFPPAPDRVETGERMEFAAAIR
jgi:hypothetical protein